MSPDETHEVQEAFRAAMQVLEAVRAEQPSLIADNLPASWGMTRLRAALATLHPVEALTS